MKSGTGSTLLVINPGLPIHSFTGIPIQQLKRKRVHPDWIRNPDKPISQAVLGNPVESGFKSVSEFRFGIGFGS
jgi:hypothetical protein